MSRLAPPPRAQLAAPCRELVVRCSGKVLSERRDLELQLRLHLVHLGDHLPEPGLRVLVVGPVHDQHGFTFAQEGAELVDQRTQPSEEALGVVGEGGSIAVAGHEVLGPHGRAVWGVPDEGSSIDRRGHAAPDHGVGETGLTEDLRHLGHVTEHVGQVADLHVTAKGRGPADAGLEVANDGLTRDQELVHEDVPGAERDAAGGGQLAQPAFCLGPDLEVVVDHRQLAVEEERTVGAVALHLVEQVVDQADQLESECLERLVPLTVPVGVGDDGDPPPAAIGGSCC